MTDMELRHAVLIADAYKLPDLAERSRRTTTSSSWSTLQKASRGRHGSYVRSCGLENRDTPVHWGDCMGAQCGSGGSATNARRITHHA